ncbi:unnamed protein product [Durusdinium trenchii]|uniref:Transmembrane protein 107 n=2 Tax=Durusdinium trenchii TaxID=1381693 RepID=A0ABP0QGU6_9DINO
MERLNQEYLSGRFVLTALHLAVTATVLRGRSDHVLFALSPGCLQQALRMPKACRQGTCAIADELSASCRQSWQANEAIFQGELTAALAFLSLELLSMLTAVHTFQAEDVNFISAVLHGGGAAALVLFIVMQTSCAYFHVVFALTNVLPFLCDLNIWWAVLRGARLKRFPPPETE